MILLCLLDTIKLKMLLISLNFLDCLYQSACHLIADLKCFPRDSLVSPGQRSRRRDRRLKQPGALLRSFCSTASR